MNTQPRGQQNGFSLVEIMIATMILTFGLLAMATGTGYVAAQLRSTSFDTQRTQAKQSMVEQMRASAFNSIRDNPSTPVTVGRFSFTWRVTLVNNQLTRRVVLITSGPAYRPGRGARTIAVDSMTFEIVMP